MKKQITIAAFCFLSAFGTNVLFADDYDSYLQQAEQATSLEQRMDFYLKAADSTKDEKKKLDMYERGFDLAKKVKMKKMISVFADRLRTSPVVSAERKASAYFEYLCSLDRPGMGNAGGSTPDMWEDFLKMPGHSPEDEQKAMLLFANNCHWWNLWYREIELLKAALDHPNTTEIGKQDILINLSKVYLQMNRMQDAMDCITTMQKMKTLTPQRRAQSYILLGDIMKKGCGFYYRPNEEDYKKICDYYMKAVKVPKGKMGGEAFFKVVEAAYDTKRYNDVINFSQQYLNGDNKKIDGATWGKIQEKNGTAHQVLEHWDEAVEIFEALYKYKYNLADTCMSLGFSYYGHGDYQMALGMYDEALVELGPACDDARPAICKGWCNKLKWFNTGKKQLDDIYAAHAKRLNKEAAAQGKGPVIKVQEADELRPFDNGKKKAKEKKPQNLKDLMKEKEDDILDSGLDL